jgi:serine/threonine protein kinase
MWAAGIIMFELLTGSHPFYEEGDDRRRIEDKLKNYDELFVFPESMSQQAKHLIGCLC